MSRPFVRAIVAVLAVWALLNIVPDLSRPFAPLGTIGLRADFSGRVTTVDPDGPAAAAGVVAATRTRAGDRIVFERTSPDALFALFGGLGGRPLLPPGEHIRLALKSPGGAPRDVTLEAAERDPPLAERVRLLLAGLLGIGTIALATFLAWNFPQRRDVFGFFLFAIWFNPGENYVFYSLLPGALRVPQELLSALVQAAGIAGFIEFALRFPTERSESWRSRVERCLPIYVISLTVLTVVGSGGGFGYPNRSIWLLTFWLKAAAYPLIVTAFLTKLRILAPVEAQRLRLIIYGCIPGLFFFLFAESIDATSLWQPVFERLGWSPPAALPNLAYLVDALVPISIGYAVLRRRVLPFDFIVNRGLTLAALFAIVAMFFEAVVLTTHILLEKHEVVSATILAIVFVALAPFVERLKHAIHEGVDRFLFPRLNRARDRFDATARGLGEASSLADIERTVVDVPLEALELAAAALFVLDMESGWYQLSAHTNWPPEALKAIPAGDRLLSLAAEVEPETTRGEALAERPGMPLGTARPSLVVALAPLAFSDAVVLYSGHADGSSLSPDEARSIVRFVHECGAARAHLQTVALRKRLALLDRTEREMPARFDFAANTNPPPAGASPAAGVQTTANVSPATSEAPGTA